MASTESDGKLIKFAVCEVSGYPKKKVEQTLGIQEVAKLKNNVRSALNKTEEIRRDVSELVAVKEQSALRSLGLYEFANESESDSSESDSESPDNSEP